MTHARKLHRWTRAAHHQRRETMIDTSATRCRRLICYGYGETQHTDIQVAAAVLRESGLTVIQDGSSLYLPSGATDADATKAGNALMDSGFPGAICW